MSALYAVRCNFQDSGLEQEWNDWYNGPKMADMLALPHFLQAQRFYACGLDADVRYLALWLLESADALQTPEYKSSWGFARWAPMIKNWSRDMIEPDDVSGSPPFPLPADRGAVHLAWFDDRTDLRTVTQHAADLGVSWWWGRCAGLDVSSSFVGLASYDSLGQAPQKKTFEGLSVHETVYRPISAAGRR